MFLDFIGDDTFGRVLEIGYGSGVFMPELSRRCGALYGIDIHGEGERVRAALAKLEVDASLSSASAERMPFPDSFFDCVVAVSSFEFIADFERAGGEVSRVLKPGGTFFVVTLGHSLLIDLGRKVLAGTEAMARGDRYKQVLPMLRRFFTVEKETTLPKFGVSFLTVYVGLKLRKKGAEEVSTKEASTR
jgi:ubiquinone/menaquinone biosynthesis C-methylase UbiE